MCSEPTAPTSIFSVCFVSESPLKNAGADGAICVSPDALKTTSLTCMPGGPNQAKEATGHDLLLWGQKDGAFKPTHVAAWRDGARHDRRRARRR